MSGEREPFEPRLAFIGKILAGLSHEFKNHLAVIKELSGLMGDLLAGEGPGKCEKRERYLEIMATQTERASLAAARAGHLNRFAHRLDEPCASFAVNEILEEELSLLAWRFRQKELQLETAFARDLPLIHNNPSLLQFAFFCLLAPGFERLAAGGRVLVSTARQEGAVRLEVGCEGLKSPAGAREEEIPVSEALRSAVQKMGAEYMQEAAGENRQRSVIIVSSLRPGGLTM
jgi:two-component system NtrC family sensor kinase